MHGARELYVQDFICRRIWALKYIVQARQEILNGVEAPPSLARQRQKGVLERKLVQGWMSSAVQAWGSYDPSQWDYRIDGWGLLEGGNNNA